MRKLVPIISVVMLLGLILSGFTQNQAAAQPSASQPQQAQQAQIQAKGKGHPQEGGGQYVKPAPYYTTSPSAQVANDPHWSAPNSRVNTDNTTYAQQEPAVAINPLNHLNVVAAQKDERRAPGPNTQTKEVWIETSTDGGASWPVQTHIPMPDNTLPQQSDAVVNFSDNNNVFVTIIGYSQSGGAAESVLVARSTDGGLTWPTAAVNVDPGLGGSDKEWTAIDLNPASPYYHRMYVTWTNFSAGPTFVEKWSSDSGVTWNPPASSFITVSYGIFDGGQFSMPVVLSNGTVIATWNDGGGQIAMGKSTDGGQSFINPNTAVVNITDVNSVPGSNWRLSTIPATTVSTATGTLVSVWADGRNGKDDTYFTRSTNSGTTWSAPARIPHNAAGSSYQVEPWVSVAPNGRFDAIWYDDRDFPSALNTFHIYASHSTDDGVTWSADEQVTDASTDLNIDIPGGPGWNGAAGDYINVASVNDYAYAVWTDTRSGTNEDIYSSRYSPIIGTPTPTVTGTPPTATPTTVPPTATTTPLPATATATATNTPPPTSTLPLPTVTLPLPTITFTTTGTPVATVTMTTTGTPAVTVTMQPSVTPTDCPNPFTDVTGNLFYTAIHYLNCRGVVNGTDHTHYSPAGTSTRGQFAKVVVLGFGTPFFTPTTQDFVDVPPSYFAYLYIESGFHAGILSGFDPASCAAHGLGTPCYLPNLPITRGQLTKLVVNAGGYTLITPIGGQQDFTDVPPSNVFYVSIETAYHAGVINGYPNHTFLPNNNIRRDEMAQIVYEGILHRPSR